VTANDHNHMTNDEVLETVDSLVTVLHSPEPDGDLFHLLYDRPLNAHNVGRILAALAIRDAEMTFQAVGLDRTHVDRVALTTFAHPDDLPDWNKAAGALLVDACNYVLVDATGGVEELAKLTAAVDEIVGRGPAFAFRCLGDVLAHIRLLIHGGGQAAVMVR
jgi:hypothetical protein